MVLVSATLPPSMVSRLSMELEVVPQVVRNSYCPARMYLEVVLLTSMQPLVDTVVDLILVAVEALEENARLLVLFMDTSIMAYVEVSLAEKGNETFTIKGQLPLEERVARATRWQRQSKGVMLATSAFGTGMDYGNISQVIHVVGAYTLLEYIQQIGRAGRLGQTCKATLVSKPMELEKYGVDGRQMDMSSMVFYSQNSSLCRRYLLDKELGSAASECRAFAENILCDICRKNAPSKP